MGKNIDDAAPSAKTSNAAPPPAIRRLVGRAIVRDEGFASTAESHVATTGKGDYVGFGVLCSAVQNPHDVTCHFGDRATS